MNTLTHTPSHLLTHSINGMWILNHRPFICAWQWKKLNLVVFSFDIPLILGIAFIRTINCNVHFTSPAIFSIVVVVVDETRICITFDMFEIMLSIICGNGRRGRKPRWVRWLLLLAVVCCRKQSINLNIESIGYVLGECVYIDIWNEIELRFYPIWICGSLCNGKDLLVSMPINCTMTTALLLSE